MKLPEMHCSTVPWCSGENQRCQHIQPMQPPLPLLLRLYPVQANSWSTRAKYTYLMRSLDLLTYEAPGCALRALDRDVDRRISTLVSRSFDLSHAARTNYESALPLSTELDRPPLSSVYIVCEKGGNPKVIYFLSSYPPPPPTFFFIISIVSGTFFLLCMRSLRGGAGSLHLALENIARFEIVLAS